MTISNSKLAYTDCYDVWDAALEHEHGVRVKMKSNDEALFFRMRMHTARQIQRRENKATYEPGDPLYDTSSYDPFTVRIRVINEQVYICVEPNTIPASAIEPIDPLAKIIEEPEEEAEEIFNPALRRV